MWLLGPLLVDPGKSEEFGKHSSFFLFPTTNSENNSKSLCSQARRPNYIVIDIVYLDVKRLWGWWRGDGTPHSLLGTKRPHFLRSTFNLQIVPSRSLFHVLWIPSQRCLFVRTWENPLKIAENWADNEMKPSKTEGWRIRKDGLFSSWFFSRVYWKSQVIQGT